MTEKSEANTAVPFLASVGRRCGLRGSRMLATRRTRPAAVGHDGAPSHAGARGWRGRARGLGRLRPVGQKRGGGPLGAPVLFFLKNSFSKYFSNIFLSILKSDSRVAPKIKFSLNKILYKFVLRCNSKIQIDFELHIKTSSRFK